MTVLLLVLVWWILNQLAAPIWCFVIFGVIVFIKLIDAFCDAIKAAVELYDNRKK